MIEYNFIKKMYFVAVRNKLYIALLDILLNIKFLNENSFKYSNLCYS